MDDEQNFFENLFHHNTDVTVEYVAEQVSSFLLFYRKY